MGLGMNAHLKTGSVDLSTNDIQRGANLSASNDNRYLNEAEQGLELCARLTALGDNHFVAHRKHSELVALIEEQFLPLAEADFNPTGAQTYRDLERLCTELEDLIQFPDIDRFYTVAVGGMFSAGKSRFLNSVIGCELLPTDTNPTTSIPTYLSQGENDAITALNAFHARIDIDEEALQAICHDFHDRFNVSFSHILRLVHVQRKHIKYPRITFLDTPGYSKSDSLDRAANIDERIARDHLLKADFLVWVIDIQNGTVPLDDILFIQSLDFKSPILFVLNKADKKTDTEIQQALASAKKDLARVDDINVYGVTAYSAAEEKEYGGQNCLDQFFHDVSEFKAGTPLRHHADMIFSEYIAFYGSERIRLQLQRDVLEETMSSPGMTSELNKRIKAMSAGAKARINDLQGAQNKMEAIQKQAVRLIEEIAEASGLTLAEVSRPVLEPLITVTKDTQIYSSKTYHFKGNTNEGSGKSFEPLVRMASLHNLLGTVRKTDSLCVYFEVENGVEVMALAGEIQKVTGLNQGDALDLLSVGTKVSIHLHDHKHCTIIYPHEP
ncbi:dynamin family protein [Desulfoluna sp.]|uniref:dynamin family protein n=1 Tax=Desulfoluna sp. TaxID=2045199 RepID=UPI0026019800|nr:dynamin family protein [Desulfoluna sp.]